MAIIAERMPGGWGNRNQIYEYLSVHLTHRNTVGKAVNITGSVLKSRGKHVDDSLRASIRDFGCWENDFGLQ